MEGVTEPSPRLGKPIRVWVWKHKLTEAEIRRYPTYSGKGWDTGVLSRYLWSLKVSLHKVAYERGQRILSLNSKIAELDPTVSIEKPLMKREDLLKQWVSLCFLLCCFCSSATDSQAFSCCSVLSSCCTGPRYYVLH
jgi:hypothetical protein